MLPTFISRDLDKAQRERDSFASRQLGKSSKGGKSSGAKNVLTLQDANGDIGACRAQIY
jgi:hypothetical protein